MLACTGDPSAPPLLPCRSDYPLMPDGARPLERFVAAANSLGQLLDAQQQEALMQVGAAQPSRWVLVKQAAGCCPAKPLGAG